MTPLKMLESTDNLDERNSFFCFICDNPIIKISKFHGDDDKRSNVQDSKLFFCSIVSRYLDLKPFEATARKTISYDQNVDNVDCCKSCSVIVKTVCELYDQLKNVQLRLNWNLGKIGEIMKNSNKTENNQGRCDAIGQFKRQFAKKVDTKTREEYPHLKVDKIIPPKEQRQNPENQNVFIIKVETCSDDDEEESYVWDPENRDEDSSDSCELDIKMKNMEPENYDNIECPVEPEDSLKVKPEPTEGEDKDKIVGEADIKLKPRRRKKIPDIEKKFPCALCGKRLSNQCSLWRHEGTFHKGETVYPCSTCGELFSNHQERRAHEVVHKVPKKPKVECRFCGKQFPRNKERVRHEWTHTKLRPFLCSVCGRRFNDAGNSVKHLRKEHGNVDDAKIVKCFNLYSDFKHMKEIATNNKTEIKIS